ncbi:hypothetical protein MUY27_16320 [Mucilaginibacter sp. RS28]|uniref:Uncharacterized protein n=1 Tax=Mucilaginibacter straminoryzae TaxID=2932774 RepID=A0A9X1X6Y5_9SPHI|nr:hypothetical protein [Mucilaginibacter straminoryzae]MCJ8211285.1 hypothetical protein [Mucilaginibacter straminoryzae]
MLKHFLSLLITITSFAAFSQTTVPEFKSNFRYINGIDTILKQGVKEYELIIAFRSFTVNPLGTDYRLLILNKGSWQRKLFHDKRGYSMQIKDESFETLPTINATCQALFTRLVAGGLFSIEDDRVYPPCAERDTVIKGVKRTYSFGVQNGRQVQIWLITPKKSRRLYYYAPDFYVNYCPPYEDRRALLKLMDLLNQGW